MTDGRALVIGEALIDVVARADGSTTRTPGGSPMNVAVGLARLDRPTTLLTRYADDAGGALIDAHLGAEAMTIDHGSPARTSVAAATLAADGSARYRFDIDWDLETPREIGHPAVVHTGSIAAVLEPGADTVEEIVESLVGQATLTYDLNLRPSVMGDPDAWRPRVRRLAAVADVLKASDEDLEAFDPDLPYVETATALLSAGRAIAFAVTRGAEGAVVITPAGMVEVAGVSTTVADTIGAGDSFMSALIDALWSRGVLGDRAALERLTLADWQDIATWAVTAAAITVSRPGADPPNRQAVAAASSLA